MFLCAVHFSSAALLIELREPAGRTVPSKKNRRESSLFGVHARHAERSTASRRHEARRKRQGQEVKKRREHRKTEKKARDQQGEDMRKTKRKNDRYTVSKNSPRAKKRGKGGDKNNNARRREGARTQRRMRGDEGNTRLHKKTRHLREKTDGKHWRGRDTKQRGDPNRASRKAGTAKEAVHGGRQMEKPSAVQTL
uniref:Uncharacterized protein n=1 Tax=Toxoplasma gondii COUG TaxID=1074873 RepID=A0A2G8XZY0_TOXGO|nr:hypothetical protein TGCOUG_393510 [Toxoplasma gondii COUG]